MNLVVVLECISVDGLSNSEFGRRFVMGFEKVKKVKWKISKLLMWLEGGTTFACTALQLKEHSDVASFGFPQSVLVEQMDAWIGH
jgi:hypothetical protein